MNEFALTCFFDALTAARAIRTFCEGKDFEHFCADDMLASAVERKFEIIGEALNRIKKKHPSISDWSSIIGFRNVLAHTYDHVEDAVAWGIVTKNIPKFIKELEDISGIESAE